MKKLFKQVEGCGKSSKTEQTISEVFTKLQFSDKITKTFA